MASFSNPYPAPAPRGGSKPPPAGYNVVSDQTPGGAPVGITPKNPGEKYKGIHVGGVGGSGTERNTPKPFKPGKAC